MTPGCLVPEVPEVPEVEECAPDALPASGAASAAPWPTLRGLALWVPPSAGECCLSPKNKYARLATAGDRRTVQVRGRAGAASQILMATAAGMMPVLAVAAASTPVYAMAACATLSATLFAHAAMEAAASSSKSFDQKPRRRRLTMHRQRPPSRSMPQKCDTRSGRSTPRGTSFEVHGALPTRRRSAHAPPVGPDLFGSPFASPVFASIAGGGRGPRSRRRRRPPQPSYPDAAV